MTDIAHAPLPLAQSAYHGDIIVDANGRTIAKVFMTSVEQLTEQQQTLALIVTAVNFHETFINFLTRMAKELREEANPEIRDIGREIQELLDECAILANAGVQYDKTMKPLTNHLSIQEKGAPGCGIITKPITADCIKWTHEYKIYIPLEDDVQVLESIRAKLISLQKMETKHGPHDADEVEHYESCECCQQFHRMEQAHDKLKKSADELARASGVIVGGLADEYGKERRKISFHDVPVQNVIKALEDYHEAGGK